MGKYYPSYSGDTKWIWMYGPTLVVLAGLFLVATRHNVWVSRAGVALLVVMCCCFACTVLAGSRLRPVKIRHEVVEVEGWTGPAMKIAAVSDQHYNPQTPPWLSEAIIDAIVREEVGAVAHLGDCVDLRSQVSAYKYTAFISGLRRALPAVPMVAIKGGHEVEETVRVTKAYSDNGVTLLENDRVTFGQVEFVGLGDNDGIPSEVVDGWYNQLFADADLPSGVKVRIFLAHDPNVRTKLIRGVRLILSGHTHGLLWSPFRKLADWCLGKNNNSCTHRRFVDGIEQVNLEGIGSPSGINGVRYPICKIDAPEIVVVTMKGKN